MLDLQAKPTLEFPDDPLKWDGWSKYKSENPYERLCLDPRTKPDEEEIQQNCNALLRWWQKKVWLKNQPTNPIAQLLGRGIDEAGRYLVQARVQLLDPARRLEIDAQLAARAEEEALAEFSKYVAFSITGRVLTAEAEANLWEYSQHNGLTQEQTKACIEAELKLHKAQRAAPERRGIPEAAPGSAAAEEEFHRILRLSRLDLGDATGLVRRIFATIADNLGIHVERAEYLLETYLDHEEYGQPAAAPAAPPQVPPRPPVAPIAPSKPSPVRASAPERKVHPAAVCLPSAFTTSVGSPMILVPAGEFVMGSEAADAAPNEQPLTPVVLSEFYMSRHPITNEEFEKFDPTHRRKRIKLADDDHPVVYVTSLEAIKFCQWLSHKDGRQYRLPTEAEWEYAARGTDGRKYPWGNEDHRGDFANFADASTTFPWRDPQVHDGYPETSPVGAFPRGASFFGIHDMAGNVWEWCLDFYQALPGVPKRNPRGLSTGSKRIYRGGSWKSRFSNLRATARSSNAANYACNDVGFRIVCESPGAEASAH